MWHQFLELALPPNETLRCYPLGPLSAPDFCITRTINRDYSDFGEEAEALAEEVGLPMMMAHHECVEIKGAREAMSEEYLDFLQGDAVERFNALYPLPENLVMWNVVSGRPLAHVIRTLRYTNQSSMLRKLVRKARGRLSRVWEWARDDASGADNLWHVDANGGYWTGQNRFGVPWMTGACVDCGRLSTSANCHGGLPFDSCSLVVCDSCFGVRLDDHRAQGSRVYEIWMQFASRSVGDFIGKTALSHHVFRAAFMTHDIEELCKMSEHSLLGGAQRVAGLAAQW